MTEDPNANNSGTDKTVPKEAFDSVKQQKIDLENERNTLKAELDRVRADQEAAKQKELEAKQEFEKLYSSEKEKREALEGSLRDTQIRSAFDKAAAEAKIVDLDAAYMLADKTSVQIVDGKVTGAQEAVKALAESKPYLVAATETPMVKIGNQVSGGSDKDSQGTLYTREQIAEIAKRDPEGFVRDREKYLPSMQKLGMSSLLG